MTHAGVRVPSTVHPHLHVTVPSRGAARLWSIGSITALFPPDSSEVHVKQSEVRNTFIDASRLQRLPCEGLSRTDDLAMPSQTSLKHACKAGYLHVTSNCPARRDGRHDPYGNCVRERERERERDREREREREREEGGREGGREGGTGREREGERGRREGERGREREREGERGSERERQARMCPSPARMLAQLDLLEV